MKTEKFTIQTFGNEYPMTSEMKISKKVFNESISNLRKQVKELEGLEFYTTEHHSMYERETYSISQYRFSNGTTDVYLIHYKCKEGYYFKK